MSEIEERKICIFGRRSGSGTDDMGKDDDKLMPLPMPNIALKEIDARDKGCARAQPPQSRATLHPLTVVVPGAIAAHLMSGCRGTLTWCA